MQQRLLVFIMISYISCIYSSGDISNSQLSNTSTTSSEQERMLRRERELQLWKGASPVMSDDEEEFTQSEPFHRSKGLIQIREESYSSANFPKYELVQEEQYDPVTNQMQTEWVPKMVCDSTRMIFFPKDHPDFFVQLEVTNRFKDQHPYIMALLDKCITPYVRYYTDSSRSVGMKVRNSNQGTNTFYFQCGDSCWDINYKQRDSIETIMLAKLGHAHIPSNIRERRMYRRGEAEKRLRYVEQRVKMTEESIPNKDNNMKRRKVDVLDNEEVQAARHAVENADLLLDQAESECRRYEKLSARCQRYVTQD